MRKREDGLPSRRQNRRTARTLVPLASGLAGLILAATLFVTAARAQTAVTINPEPKGYAWWLRAEFHAVDTEIRGIPVKAIRSDWCKATEFEREMFPANTLVENGVDLLEEAGLSFSLEGAFDGTGKTQVALVGVYETCKGQKGRFLLILDSATLKVRFLETDTDQNQFSAIGPEGRSAIRVAYCLECDQTAVVRWNSARKRFLLR